MQKIYLHNQEIAVPKHSSDPKRPIFLNFFPPTFFLSKIVFPSPNHSFAAVPCFLSSLRLLLLIDQPINSSEYSLRKAALTWSVPFFNDHESIPRIVRNMERYSFHEFCKEAI